MNSPYCFIAGTVVLTATGHVAIETVQPGDLVWATDPDTDRTELKHVVQTFINETTELVHITVNDEVISCTPEHPFYCPTKGWTVACKLRAGDILVTVNGEYVVVEKIQHELLESPIFVYNFEVEGFHTYYAGNMSILTHNRCSKYYKATRVDDGIEIGAQISKKQALNRLRNGMDVYTESRAAAKSLAKKAFGNSKV